MSLVTYKKIDNHIGIITLNRPSAANALSTLLLHELNDSIELINQDNNIRSGIVVGTGEKAFCAGADLKERKEMTDKEVVHAVAFIRQTIQRIESIAVPVIAAINGVAFGGGLELALACDIRIAAENVKVGLTETSLAIIPRAGMTQRVSRVIAIEQAQRLIYYAKAIGAEEAYELGIFEEIVPFESLLVTAIDEAKQMAENGPIAIQQAKLAIDRGI